MPRDVFHENLLGDVDAQRVMEKLHAKWGATLRKKARANSAPPEGPDLEEARRSTDRARVVIAQKDRARQILARIGDARRLKRNLARHGVRVEPSVEQD